MQVIRRSVAKQQRIVTVTAVSTDTESPASGTAVRIPFRRRLMASSASESTRAPFPMKIQPAVHAAATQAAPQAVILFSAEISKIVNAYEVFEALSRGFSKYKDLLSQSHVSSGPTLVDVLDKLMKMEVVEKKY